MSGRSPPLYCTLILITMHSHQSYPNNLTTVIHSYENIVLLSILVSSRHTRIGTWVENLHIFFSRKSCSEHSTTIHAFRSATTNEGVSSRPMNDIRVLYHKQTKMTYFPKNKVLQKKYSFEEAIFVETSSRSRSLKKNQTTPRPSEHPPVIGRFLWEQNLVQKS